MTAAANKFEEDYMRMNFTLNRFSRVPSAKFPPFSSGDLCASCL